MLVSIVSVSAVCLALAISGWVPPDPHTSAVTSTVTFGQLWHQSARLDTTASSSDSIVSWLGYFVSPADVVTDQNSEDICSCRPVRKPEGSSLWPLNRIPQVTDLDTGVIWGTIDQLTEDITYGLEFTVSTLRIVFSPTPSFVDEAENTGNFLVATWQKTVHIRDMTVGETVHRPHVFFYLGSWVPILPLFIILLLRGKKKRVNTHYVYSIKDVQKALAKGRRRFGHREENLVQVTRPNQEKDILPRGKAHPQPAFGHGDFSQTFRLVHGKVVVHKLRRDMEKE